MGSATGLLELPVVIGLTGVFEGTGAEEKDAEEE